MTDSLTSPVTAPQMLTNFLAMKKCCQREISIEYWSEKQERISRESYRRCEDEEVI
jgi:hypothetical protein